MALIHSLPSFHSDYRNNTSHNLDSLLGVDTPLGACFDVLCLKKRGEARLSLTMHLALVLCFKACSIFFYKKDNKTFWKKKERKRKKSKKCVFKTKKEKAEVISNRMVGMVFSY